VSLVAYTWATARTGTTHGFLSGHQRSRCGLAHRRPGDRRRPGSPTCSTCRHLVRIDGARGALTSPPDPPERPSREVTDWPDVWEQATQRDRDAADAAFDAVVDRPTVRIMLERRPRGPFTNDALDAAFADFERRVAGAYRGPE